jgi:tetratricopeptide (TPR) repeat protein
MQARLKIPVISGVTGLYVLLVLLISTRDRYEGARDAEEDPLKCALFIANTIKKDHSRDFALYRIGSQYADTGSFQQAIQIASNIGNDFWKSSVLYKITLGVKDMQRGDIMNLLPQLLRLAYTIEKTEHKAESLALIARAYSRTGRIKKAKDLFSQAIQLTITLRDSQERAHTLAHIAGICASAGLKDKRGEAIYQAIKVTSTMEDGFTEGWSKSNLLDYIAGKCTKDEEYEELICVAEGMEDHFWKACALRDIVDRYSRQAQKEGYLKLLSRVLEVTATIKDPETKSYALIDIGCRYHKLSKTDRCAEIFSQALELANNIENPCDRAERLAHLASKYREIGEVENSERIEGQVIRLTNTIDNLVKRAKLLESIALRQVETGQKESAMKVLPLLVQVARVIKDSREKDELLGSAARMYTTLEEYDDACRIVEHIQEPFGKSIRLTEIGVGWAKTGYKQEAEKLLSQAVELSKRIKKASHRNWALYYIAGRCVKAGMREIVSQLTKVARAIDEASERAEALGYIVIRCIQVGWNNEALQIIRLMEDGIAKTYVLIEMVGKYIEGKQEEKAQGILYQALRVARTINEGCERAVSLVEIACQYSKIWQGETTPSQRSILREMIGASTALSNN